MLSALARLPAHHVVFALFALFVSDLWRASTTLLPDAFLRQFHLPWARHAPSEPTLSNPLLSDIPWMFEAKREEARRQILAGELPLWDARSELGQPLLANQQCALLSPFTWPQLWLGVREGWDLSIALELIVLLYGARALLRRLGAADPWASAGALLLACTGMCTVWRGYPVSAALAWMPWLWLSTLGLAGGGRWAFVGAVLVRVLLLFSGHPETAFKLLVADALLALLRPTGVRLRFAHGQHAFGRSVLALLKVQLRRLAQVAAAGLLALGLSAPLTLPTLEYLRESHALVLREKMREPQRPPPVVLATLLWPDAFGSPIVHRRIEPDWAGPMNYSEIQAFVSLGVLLAAALSLRRSSWDEWTRALCVLMVCGGALAYAWGPLTQLLNRVPLLRISAPPRWSFVLQAALVLQAARMLSALARDGRPLGAAALALVALAQAVPFTLSFHPPSAHADLPGTTPELALLQAESQRGGRILPLGLLEPGEHLSFGLASLQSYDAIGVRRSREILDRIGLGDRRPALLDRIDPSLLSACDVRWLFLPRALPRAVPLSDQAARLPPGIPIDVPVGSTPFTAGLFVSPAREQALWLEDGLGTRARLPLEPGCELVLAGRRIHVEAAGPSRRMPGDPGAERRARIVVFEAAETPAVADAALVLRAIPEEDLFLAPVLPLRAQYRRIDPDLPCPIYAIEPELGSVFALSAEQALPRDVPELASRLRQRELAKLEPEREGSSRVSVMSSGAAARWIAFSRVLYPGWQARLDGVLVDHEELAGLYPAVRVPAGSHRVEWVYAPRSLELGLIIAGLALLLVLLALYLAVPSRRAAQAASP